MIPSSKTSKFSPTRLARRFLARPWKELSRTGRIFQTLWDAAQLQAQQRRYFEQIGAQCVKLVRDGKLKDLGIERTIAKIDQVERIIARQEQLLRGYQSRVDVGEVLRGEVEGEERIRADLGPV